MKINREIVNYLVFGVLTTIVSIITFSLFGIILGEEFYLLNNVLSWIISVTFAYVTNKIWVFESKSWHFTVIKTEIIKFLAARLFSLGLEEAGLYLLIDVAKFGEFGTEILNFEISGVFIAKIIMQIIVVLSNYFFSKFIIFNKKQ